MSQFDLPRLHFHGRFQYGAATANNVNNTPLTFYDPILSQLVLPPRMYLANLSPDVREKVLAELPAGTAIQNEGKDDAYFCIEPISADISKEAFTEWLITPLGAAEIDADYHSIYQLIPAIRSPEGGMLYGKIPGYWNCFGPMQLNFEAVKVCSLAVLEQEKEVLWTPESPDLPPELAPFLEAELGVRQDPHDPNSSSSAVMLDVTPSTSTASQIFCDNMFLKGKDDTLFFQAKPSIAILRGLHFSRVVNVNMPQSASGEFFCVIASSQLEEDNPLLRFFQKWGNTNRTLKGIFIRYNLFEVFENRHFSYLKEGEVDNPARMTLAGSLSPWYEDDLETIGIGRQLQSVRPFTQYEDQKKYLPPLLLHLDKERKRITFDLLNNIPETFGKDGQYEALDLGNWEFRLDSPDTPCGSTPPRGSKLLGQFETGPKGFSRGKNLLHSGLISFPLNATEEEWQKGVIRLYQAQPGQPKACIMEETDYVIYSEQAGLYANQGDDPAQGYLSRSNQKEPCHLRIWQKGRPAPAPVLLTVIEFKVDLSGTHIQSSVVRHARYADGDIITFSTDEPKNSIYLLLPGAISSVPAGGFPSIFLTGSIIHLRVLPRQDYGRYLDPGHPEFPQEVTWQVIYDEVLRTYDFIYPAMGKMFPFTREAYENKSSAQRLLDRISIHHWDRQGYMPVTRDLSDVQRALLYKWGEQFGWPAQESQPISPIFTEAIDLHRHR